MMSPLVEAVEPWSWVSLAGLMVQLVEQEEWEEWTWQEAEALESCVGEQFKEVKD